MYDHIDHYATTEAPQAASEAEVHGRPQVIWVGPEDSAAGHEADPYDVINFLLKKVEDQQARIAEHEGFSDLQNQEIEQIKAQFDAKRLELEATQVDYDVVLQNGLAAEHELELARVRVVELELAIETYKQKSHERPRIQLPFHTEQKLVKLGYAEAEVSEA